MDPRVRHQPPDLVREVRVVLKAGSRPPRLAYEVGRLPALTALCAGDVPDSLPYDQAGRIVEFVEDVIHSLGDGPYGCAVAALFGTRASSRGLLLAARRREAARELGIEVATLIRHWERDIISDVAVGIYAHGRSRAETNQDLENL